MNYKVAKHKVHGDRNGIESTFKARISSIFPIHLQVYLQGNISLSTEKYINDEYTFISLAGSIVAHYSDWHIRMKFSFSYTGSQRTKGYGYITMTMS